MNIKKFSDAMSEIDSKYVDEAINYKRVNGKSGWIKWGTVAACFALVAILGIGALQGEWFSSKTDIATLSDGNTINFVKSDKINSSLELGYDIVIRELTEEETHTLFADLPVIASAVFNATDNKLVGFEGTIADMKMVITTSDLPLLDTAIVGIEEAAEVNGILVKAGYFLTDPNSNGEQTAIYYAAFEIGNSTVYVENAGTKAERETVKNELATVIQKLIANGELDTSQF